MGGRGIKLLNHLVKIVASLKVLNEFPPASRMNGVMTYNISASETVPNQTCACTIQT